MLGAGAVYLGAPVIVIPIALAAAIVKSFYEKPADKTADSEKSLTEDLKGALKDPMALMKKLQQPNPMLFAVYTAISIFTGNPFTMLMAAGQGISLTSQFLKNPKEAKYIPAPVSNFVDKYITKPVSKLWTTYFSKSEQGKPKQRVQSGDHRGRY